MKILENIIVFLEGKKVKVTALVGASGTGKSFRARLLADKLGIELIIDDGLLIREDKILAGYSAKREKQFLAAVKVALFDDKAHRDEVAKVLQRRNLKSILILGTSEKMVNKIAMRLQLPQPQEIIHIEDIATKEEIEIALRSRNVEGKHVIPVPSIEVKKNYPQIFYDKVRLFFKRKRQLGPEYTRLFEKSVVRPEFSKTAAVKVSESALTEMLLHCIKEYNKDTFVKTIVVQHKTEGYLFIITIDPPFETQLTGWVNRLKSYIIENIEKYTGILILEVNIIIDKIRKTETVN